MTEHTIKQRINNNSIPPTPYSVFKKHHSIAIAESGGKYGLITDSGEELLPFAYDNISLVGFSLYLLIQNGKIGLLHARFSEKDPDDPLEIFKQIPCEYDFITLPNDGESFVLLRKDGEKSSITQIYFTKTKTLNGPIWKVLYQDRDYIVAMEDDQCTEKILSRSGQILYTTSGPPTMRLICETYETFQGTVFVEIRDYFSASLILIKKRRIEGSDPHSEDDYCYELTGDVEKYTFDSFIEPILSNQHYRTLEREFALGFLVMNQFTYQALDGKCKPICDSAFDSIKVSTSISSKISKNTYWDTQLSGMLY